MSAEGPPRGANCAPWGGSERSERGGPMTVGVIGIGAMGMGVLASLLRGNFPGHGRDMRAEAHLDAEALGATCHPHAASLARVCDIAIVLVVDAMQVDDVLFGADGAAAAFRPGAIVMLSSTVAP